MKYFLIVMCVLAAGFSKASAHVVVKPLRVGIASFQTFDTSVPSEKDIPTVSLRLIIPSGLSYVTPTVKPGWKIDIKKEGDAAKEITWSGGVIPPDQRDDFTVKSSR